VECNLYFEELYGGRQRNRTPILSERRFSGPVADHSARTFLMERRPGLEPGKTGVAIPRLDHFGIRRLTWREWGDSNPLLAVLEAAALPVALHSRGGSPGIRTQTDPILSRMPLPIGLESRNFWWPASDSNRENLFLLREAPLPV
jgi:hypothetical protein